MIIHNEPLSLHEMLLEVIHPLTEQISFMLDVDSVVSKQSEVVFKYHQRIKDTFTVISAKVRCDARKNVIPANLYQTQAGKNLIHQACYYAGQEKKPYVWNF